MRLARIVTVVCVAMAATATGIAAASGFGPSAAATAPGAGALTAPAKHVPNGGAKPHGLRSNARAANAATYNWAGYVASGSTYTSVSAKWTQPTVLCSSKGIVSFWVGLDGWGDGTVEQDGTGVDCRSGTPKYYAWWETYPTNSQQMYTGVTVAPGDDMESTVNYANGNYTLTLADTDQNWSRTTTVAAPSGATNASAEVIAEAASVNGAITTLPNFHSIGFSAATINGGSLADAGAQPIDMNNQGNQPIAQTAPGDSTAGAFTVTFTGGANVHGAFEAAGSSDLFTYDTTGSADAKDQLQANTSPSVAFASGTRLVAYQQSGGHLMILGPKGPVDSGLGMMASTSPSIAMLSDGSFVIAFQANTGFLWVYSSVSGGMMLGLGMMNGTSPSVTALPNNGFEIAFQANTGHLWTYSTAGKPTDLMMPMASGTSPSIATLPGGAVEIAFQGGTGTLWTTPGTVNGKDSGQAMADGSSPAIAATTAGDWRVAFESAAGSLSSLTAAGKAASTNWTVQAGTSPDIAAVSTGGYEMAVHSGDNGDFVVTGDAGTVDTAQPMVTGSSPAITS